MLFSSTEGVLLYSEGVKMASAQFLSDKGFMPCRLFVSIVHVTVLLSYSASALSSQILPISIAA
jgi:hypothetical protein